MNASARILLIEDDSGITDTLQRVLAAEGHDVAIEKRGDAGLARGVKDSFNLVITDLKLPGLNGLELVRQLHIAKPRLPIILVTAIMELGALVCKPRNPACPSFSSRRLAPPKLPSKQ